MQLVRWSWLVALGLALLACAADEQPATAVAVSVKTDMAPGRELRDVGAWVLAPTELDDVEPSGTPDFTWQDDELARPLVVTRRGADRFLLVVRGTGPDDQPIEYRARAAFEAGKTLRLPVFLARDCGGRSCGAGSVCYGQREGAVCEGACGPVPTLAALSEVRTPGEETTGWTRSACECVPTALPGATCNLVTQCGCPIGQSCDLTFADGAFTARCKPAGPVPAGELCSREDPLAFCARGLACVGGQGFSVCRTFCDTPSECGARADCDALTDERGQPIANANFCAPTCSAGSDCASGCCYEGNCYAKQLCDLRAPDGGAPDAGSRDGGRPSGNDDAGSATDASAPDASQPRDASTPPDAGAPPDAGPPPPPPCTGAALGYSCTAQGDCCGNADGKAHCVFLGDRVQQVCRANCTSHAECATGCCGRLTSTNLRACQPSAQCLDCPTGLARELQTCRNHLECCGGASGRSYCVRRTNSLFSASICRSTCSADGECAAGECCRAVTGSDGRQTSDKVCAPCS